MDVLWLIVGLAGLWAGTELTLRGALQISRHFGLSEFVVGVAVLSIGSDLPELVVAVDASLRIADPNELAGVVVGTALGSCVGQIAFVLGVAGLLGYVTLPRHIVVQHGGVMLGALGILGLMGFDGAISRTEGGSLLVLYAIYLALLAVDRGGEDVEEGDGRDPSPWIASAYVAVGLAVVFGGAEATLHGVVGLARSFEIDTALISILAIGLGTSLPELSISIAAMRKNRSRMSVGNLIGSNIFDTLVPIGAAAVVREVSFGPTLLRFDLPFLFMVSTVALAFFLRKRGLRTGEALALLSMYGGYVVLRVLQS